MPSGPSSRESVFAHPTTPGRTAFESARLSAGSLTVLGLDVDHAAGRASPKVRQAELRQADGGDEEERDGGLERLVVDLERGTARRPAAVVDQDVDAAEGLDRALHEPLAVLRVRDVALDGQGSEPLRLGLDDLPPAREHRDVHLLGGEGLGDREAHSLRRPADDRRAAAQPKIHTNTTIATGSTARQSRRPRSARVPSGQPWSALRTQN